MQTQTCNVCVTERNTAKFITCPGCEFSSCMTCQKSYGRPSCMQCRCMFSRRFARMHFGATYVTHVLKPELHAERIEAERQLLPGTQPFVDWELNRRAIASRLRFGEKVLLPPKPPIPNVDVATGFACPSNGCRGFVYKGACGTCKIVICIRCREAHGSERTCDPRIVESIALIERDCKPCPSCKTLIHKTEGCDHMKCTYCGVHFAYRSLRIMKTSTNHHYNTAAPIRAQNQQIQQECVAEDEQLDDGIPRDIFAGPRALIKVLYDDRDCIRFIKESMYDDDKIVAKAHMSLHNLRLKYLLSEIKETAWIRGIVLAQEVRDASLARSFLLSLLLQETKALQRAAHHSTVSNVTTISTSLATLATLYKMIDDNLQEIKEEYGGPNMRMRTPLDPPGAPPIRM